MKTMKTTKTKKPTTPPPLCACGCGKPVTSCNGRGGWSRFITGHGTSYASKCLEEAPPLCACGCGQPVKWNKNKRCWRKFILGHYVLYDPHLRAKIKAEARGEPPLCACGCGQPVRWKESRSRWSTFADGHYVKYYSRLLDEKKSKEPLHFCACGCGQVVERRSWVKGKKKNGRWNRFIKSHYGIYLSNCVKEARGEPPLCACGCGKPVEWNNTVPRWYKYYSPECLLRMRKDREPKGDPPLCACGCGKAVGWNKGNVGWNKYCGHHVSYHNFIKFDRFRDWASKRGIPKSVQDEIIETGSFAVLRNPNFMLQEPVKKKRVNDYTPRFVSVYKNVTRGMFYSP